MEAATKEQVDTFGGAKPVPKADLFPSFTNASQSAFFFQMTQGLGFVNGNISQSTETTQLGGGDHLGGRKPPGKVRS